MGKTGCHGVRGFGFWALGFIREEDSYVHAHAFALPSGLTLAGATRFGAFDALVGASPKDERYSIWQKSRGLMDVYGGLIIDNE